MLITGATDGFGRYVADKLAARGGTVLLHGRNQQKLERTAQALRTANPQTTIETYMADFADLGQVARMAQEIAKNHQALDLLINNVGIGFGAPGAPRQTNKDGQELRFVVNYLAAYLLTKKLLPLLRASGQARIVNVASLGQAPLDFDDIMLEHGYSGTRAYGQSKLAVVMETFDLADALRGDHITVNALHPATYADTNMVHEAGVTPMSTVADGGESILWLATSPEVAATTGQFFNQRQPERADDQAYDQASRQQLHALTEALLSAY